MKTYKITKNMKESVSGYREYVFWNDDENGNPIDKELFRQTYELLEKARIERRAELKKLGLL